MATVSSSHAGVLTMVCFTAKQVIFSLVDVRARDSNPKPPDDRQISESVCKYTEESLK